MALILGIQTYQILTKDDEVCIPSLSSVLLAVNNVSLGNIRVLFELIEWIYSYIPWVIGSYLELLPKMVNKDASRFFLSMSYCAATLK